MTIQTRRAESGDAGRVASLLTQLGYPTRAADVPARLARMTTDDHAAVFVAEQDGIVVGLATAHIVRVLNRPTDVTWLTTLVVDETVRGSGVGRALVDAVAEFGREAGCEWLSVTTHERRSDAHAFYDRIGFQFTGRRFGRALRRHPEERSDEEPALEQRPSHRPV
jgi:GNAT superfamily N-acetyltransferase